jgi:hypothetical protein
MRFKKPRLPCPVCQKIVENDQSIFCSLSCFNRSTYLKYIESWKAGLETGTSKVGSVANPSLSEHVRRYLFEKFESVCTKCGWCRVHPTTGKVPLEVEHKDGNAMNCKEENLDLICPGCHSLTPTFRGLNRGNGRKSRQKRVSPVSTS